jgi:outer membrane protein assembly factor BamB
MSGLRPVGFLSVAGLLLFSVAAASAQARGAASGLPTTVSTRYVVVGAHAVVPLGNAVYVAGVSRVAPPTGSAVVVSAGSGKAESVNARVAGGSVSAAVPDGSGGWYVGGSFTSVGGVARPGLAHLLSDGTLDAAFAPPELGQVTALALDAGRLYVGGVRPLASPPSFSAFLSAVDTATGALLPVSYPLLPHVVVDDETPLYAVVALAAGGGRLFAAFNADNGIAAYDESTGALSWSRPATLSYGKYDGPATLALAAGKLLVGGEISTPGGRTYLQELDPATGVLLTQPAIGGQVSRIATVGDTAYLLVGRNGEGVWKLNLSSGLLTHLATLRFCSAIATDGKTLYVAGSTSGLIGSTAFADRLRVYALDLGRTKPTPWPLSEVVAGGGMNALSLQKGRLLVGGSFLGMGGVERAGLAAFDARTGALRPWRPATTGGQVKALAGSGKTIYLGGAFKRVAGRPRNGLAAVSTVGAGKLLPWHPRLSQASIGSLAVADGLVFAGGSAKPYKAKHSAPFSHLLAFSARTGKQVAFAPQLGHVNLLAVGQHLLLAENSCDRGGNRISCVTAFRVGGKGHAGWRQSIKGSVSVLEPAGSTLYIGGWVRTCANCPSTSLLAALALARSGARLNFAPDVTQPVSALAETESGLVVATAFEAGGGPYFNGAQALGAVTPAGQVLPWQITFPPNDVFGGASNSAVGYLVPVPGGLVASGSFSWIGPPDNPAPGSLVWLR